MRRYRQASAPAPAPAWRTGSPRLPRFDTVRHAWRISPLRRNLRPAESRVKCNVFTIMLLKTPVRIAQTGLAIWGPRYLNAIPPWHKGGRPAGILDRPEQSGRGWPRRSGSPVPRSHDSLSGQLGRADHGRRDLRTPAADPHV